MFTSLDGLIAWYRHRYLSCTMSKASACEDYDRKFSTSEEELERLCHETGWPEGQKESVFGCSRMLGNV